MLRKLVFAALILSGVQSFAQDTGARYLIITHDDYYDILKPLAQWKTQKGIKAKIAKTSDIGSDSAQIRDFIINAYNTWQIRPEYLLLVGNKYQVPFPRMVQHTEICNSDNYYTNILGDFRNEIIPGRLWVSDTLAAQTVVAKILGYEREPYMFDSLWFKKGITIVNEDQDSTTSDSVYWADARYMHDLMINAGFIQIDSLSKQLDHDTVDLLDAINDGRSYILYRGCGFGDWSYPFNLFYPGSMKNYFKLPIVVSGTCATIEGIGQLWLNAGSPEEPRGIVGFFGTTTALMGADSLRSALVKGTLNSVFTDSLTTLGKAAEAGRLKYYNMFGDSLEYDSWTCLGDPAMELWAANQKRFSVIHDNMIPIGPCTLNVNVQHNSTSVEGALVCMRAKQDSSLHCIGKTDNFGDISFIDTSHVVGDSVFLSVTKTTFIPYFGIAQVPYYAAHLALHSFGVLDTTGGNGDFIANPGEDIEIPVCIMNWGDSVAYNVSGVLQQTLTDPYFSVHDTVKYFGDISPLDSAKTSDDGYNVMISAQCPDSHEIDLTMVMKDNNNSIWISEFSFYVNSPEIELSDYYFPFHSASIPPGDTDQFFVELHNSGSANAENVIGEIYCNDSFVIIIDSVASFGHIPPDSSGTNTTNPFVIAADPITPPCYETGLTIITTSGVIVDTSECTMYVGRKDYLVLDLDPNHTSGPLIQACLDTLLFYGDYTQIHPQGFLSIYQSIFVCAGIYPDNFIIKDTSVIGHEIEKYLGNQGGKAYLEGGDVWHGDPQFHQGYHLYPYFNILPVANSVGPLTHVSGENGTFAQSMVFNYSGEHNSIDRIDSDSIGVLIFKNTANSFNCGVAANNKTVGVSFELGGLDDSVPPSTKLALVDSIMQYFGITPTGVSESGMSQRLVTKSIGIYPNPAKQKVTMEFIGFSAGDMNVKIYDVCGRLVKDVFITLDGLCTTRVNWDGTDEHGDKLASGVYFLKFNAEDYAETKKFVLLR
jgi:hypothetical protein